MICLFPNSSKKWLKVYRKQVSKYTTTERLLQQNTKMSIIFVFSNIIILLVHVFLTKVKPSKSTFQVSIPSFRISAKVNLLVMMDIVTSFLNTPTKTSSTFGHNCFHHTQIQIVLHPRMPLSIIQLKSKQNLMNLIQLGNLEDLLKILLNIHFQMDNHKNLNGGLQLECIVI